MFKRMTVLMAMCLACSTTQANVIFSVSGSPSIAGWDGVNGQLVSEFLSPSNENMNGGLVVGDGVLYGVRNGNIGRWDVDTGQFLGSFGGVNIFGDLAYSNGVVYSVSGGTSIAGWDSITGQLVSEFTSLSGNMNGGLVIGDGILYGNSNGSIGQWEIATGNHLGSFGSVNIFGDLAYSNGVVYSVSGSPVISRWDSNTGQALPAFMSPSENMNGGLAAGNGILYGVRNGNIGRWDINTGDFLGSFGSVNTFGDLATTSTPTVPAPATLALFGLGLAGLGFSSRKTSS